MSSSDSTVFGDPPHHQHRPDETSPLLNPRELSPEEEDEDEDTMSRRIFWTLACVYGASAVGLGAFGAHALKKYVGDDARKLANWSTAAQYQLVHSGVLLFASGASPLASGLLTAGMTMFSGSLYALTLDTERFRWMGPVTPLGGLCLMGGWAALGFASRGRAGGFRIPSRRS